MKNEARTTVAEFLKAVQQGDNEKLGAILHPDIVWNQPGDNRVSGIKNNNLEVFQMVGKMFELSGNSLRLTEIKTMAVNGNRVTCLLQWSATKPDNSVLEVENIDLYVVEKGQIVKADVFSADLAKEDQFWQ